MTSYVIGCTCGNEITFHGLIPNHYKCGKCGEHIRITNKELKEKETVVKINLREKSS